MNFGVAVAMLKNGHKMKREGWNDKGMWIALQKPDENSKMTLPYIYMRTCKGNLVPWTISQSDILSEDWQNFNNLEGELK